MIIYDELVTRRKMCRICMQTDPDKIHNGNEFNFDPPVISYWSQWLGHQQPRILIVGQDFSNVEYFFRYRGIDEPGNETNENLRKLLFEAGVEVGEPPGHDPVTPVFLTNSILCLKSGPMNAPIKERWVDTCAQNHLLSLTNYLNPSIVVGMGTKGWRAVRHVFQLGGAPQSIKLAAGGSWGDSSRDTRICRRTLQQAWDREPSMAETSCRLAKDRDSSSGGLPICQFLISNLVTTELS